VATILPPPPPSPDPEKEKPFDLLKSQKRQQQEQSEPESEKEQSEIVRGIGHIEDGPGLVPEGSNEFGLTAKDAIFIEYDIRKAIEDFDREYGFDGVGYHYEHGNYIHTIDKGKELDEKRRCLNKRRNKISAQEVAITKGIIKIRRPSDDDDNKEEHN
jgi:hypothetical protein